MFREKDNSTNDLGSIVFMVLFFIFICAFAGNTEPPAARDSHYKSVSALNSQVIPLNNAQRFTYQKNVIRILENTDFKKLSDCYQIIGYNRSIQLRILLLHKTELLIKHVLVRRVFPRFHSTDTDDAPVLS